MTGPDFQPLREDPLDFFSRVLTRLNSEWLRQTYPFAGFGRKTSIHYSCDIRRSTSSLIDLSENVYLAQDVWLNLTLDEPSAAPRLLIGKGCKIGRRSSISCRNYICLEDDVLLAPSVLIMDHNHEYRNPEIAIHAQGNTAGGRITIGRNCWLGHSAVISCGKGTLEIGRNSVVGANAVVTKSFPPFSVIAGNPAVLIRKYDPDSAKWVRTVVER